MAGLRNKKGFTRKRDWVQYAMGKFSEFEKRTNIKCKHKGCVMYFKALRKSITD